MNTIGRYVILVLAVLITIHYTLSFTHQEYGNATSLSNIASHWQTRPASVVHAVPDHYYVENKDDSLHTNAVKANATFVMLARNSDLDGVLRSVRDAEDRFNRKWGYPWTFLNEEPFTDEFKQRVSNLINSPVEFGLVPKEHWDQPDWIDEAKATEERNKMVAENVIYGGSKSYRNMCRYNSGFFYRHELMQKYRWYWRVEPDIHFHCDIDFDPFVFMEQNDKVYGFTVAIYEYRRTIETLWDHVTDFAAAHPEFIAEGNAMGFLSENGGKDYNLCHFWSNFEIADMDNLWRAPAYTAFFDYLDSKGGFYYERWGDAPVHSIGASLFARADQIHFFNEIGYEHNPYTHCPTGDTWARGRCGCAKEKSFDYDGYSCMKHWDRVSGS